MNKNYTGSIRDCDELTLLTVLLTVSWLSEAVDTKEADSGSRGHEDGEGGSREAAEQKNEGSG